MINYTEGAPVELFNVVGDPGERHDLSAQRPDLVARMRQQLADWDATVDRSITGADYPEEKVLPSGSEPRSSP